MTKIFKKAVQHLVSIIPSLVFLFQRGFFTLTFLFLSFTVPIKAKTAPSLDKELQSLSQNHLWHLLIHYRPGVLKKYVSEADGSNFFLSKDGKYNPLSELKSTYQAMLASNKIPKIGRPAKCAFPARFHFLKENLPKELTNSFADVKCPDYAWWKENLNAKSVDLVFSSNYPNNPASVFGHTFLVLRGQKKAEIDDYALGFAAQTDEGEGGFFYALSGVFGGYKGQYNTNPYYMKLNEYTNKESRDLWEYKLNLKPEEVDRMTNHLWELGTNTYFDYYFFHQNCSYQLLTLLEVARPSLDLTSGHILFTLPSDTVKRVNQEHLVKSVNYRPSFRKKMMYQRELLSANQSFQLGQVIKGAKDVGQVQDAQVLESLMAIYRYKQFKSEKDPKDNPELRNQLRKTLLARAKLGKVENKRAFPPLAKNPNLIAQNPLLSHASYKINMSAGIESSTNDSSHYYDLEFRSGLHNLKDREVGYPPSIEIQFLSLKARVFKNPETKNSDLRIQHFDFVKIFSLIPFDPIDFEFSWNVHVKGHRPVDIELYNRNTDLVPFAQAGFGTFWNFPKNITLYSMLNAWLELPQGTYKKTTRFGPSFFFGIKYNINPQQKLVLDTTAGWDLIHSKLKGQSYNHLKVAPSYHYYPHKDWSLSPKMEFIKTNILPKRNQSKQRFTYEVTISRHF